jgi:hypothetical protein
MRFYKSFAIVILAGVTGLLVAPHKARGDALIVTRAMTATTIAEIFIAEDSIRVELEIGVDDLIAFRNLMPDQIYERMGYEPESFVTRLERFLAEDWTINLPDGAPLSGGVASLEARPRVVRDEVTGEPLPAADKEPEPVVFAVLAYELPEAPASLTFKPPAGDDARFVRANIGFVVYHMGLPVTDFRYLGTRETLVLDWDDPWYSRFENKNLRRRFDAPLSAFLYVENYEVRKEIIARPKDLQNWVDLGLAGKDTIRVGEQEELKNRVAEYFTTRSEVTIDGRSQEPILDRIHFVRRSLRRTGIIDPPEDLPLISATLGVIYIYPIDSLPDVVSMNWELFTDRIQRVPSSATDEAGGLPYFLTPEDSVLLWQNFLTNPTVPTLAAISAPRSGVPVPLVSALCIVALAAMMATSAGRKKIRRRRIILAAAALIAVSAAAWPLARIAVPIPGLSGMSQAETESVVSGLLTNVYRAFDYRDENVIYDTLDRSASGDLLTRVYLETRRALELQSQGGARVKVKDVDMSSVVAEPLDGEKGFTARCTWTVSGSVGHWGHIHTRVNQYDALLTIQDVGGVWKITGLDLVEEKRVS